MPDQAPSLDELSLAFVQGMATYIIEADGQVTDGERRVLERLAPRAAMEAAGFVGPDGVATDALWQTIDRALLELPRRLARDQKLAMLRSLLDATLADDELDFREGALLKLGARFLGLHEAVLDELLGERDDQVAELELPEPLTD